MKVTVILYGGLKREAGGREHVVELARERPRVVDLVDTLVDRFPALQQRLDGVAFAVNNEIVDADFILRDGDEASLLPPVSGG